MGGSGRWAEIWDDVRMSRLRSAVIHQKGADALFCGRSQSVCFPLAVLTRASDDMQSPADHNNNNEEKKKKTIKKTQKK